MTCGPPVHYPECGDYRGTLTPHLAYRLHFSERVQINSKLGIRNKALDFTEEWGKQTKRTKSKFGGVNILDHRGQT